MTVVTRPARASKAFVERLRKISIAALFLMLASSHNVFAQTAPSLGTAASFAVLGASTVTNTGPSVVTGDLGLSPGTSITGFPPGVVVGGSIHQTDAVAGQAQIDTTIAYNLLAGQACNTTYAVPTDIGGLTLVPGVYCFASSAGLTGTVTLDAQGNPNAVFIFKTVSTLITASNSTVALVNGAQQCKVFWQVGSSATLGTGTNFVGSILALASITLNTNATLSGRALAQTAAVTLDSNLISVPSCAGPPVTLGKSFSQPTIVAGGISTLTITLGNPGTAAASLTSPLTDTMPAGLVVSGNALTSCGGSVAAVAGGSSVTLTGGSIPAGGSCTVMVDVTAPTAGTYINSLPAGALQTSNGSNSAPAVATLIATPVAPPLPVPPTIGKSFSPSSITLNSVSTLTVTLSNSNATVDALTAPLTDQLPLGLTISGNASTTCGGAVTAAKGSTFVTLTSGYIPASGSCTVTVDVVADCACSYNNTIPAGALQTVDGVNASPAVATLTVTNQSGAPVVYKAFYPSTVKLGGTSQLTLVLQNPNPAVATLTAPFTDNLPAGVSVYAAGNNSCGGKVTAVKGGSAVTLTGGSIPINGSCSIVLQVTSASAGTYLNTIGAGALQTSNGSNASAATATLTVSTTLGNGPAVTKSFVPSSIKANGLSTLLIGLQNPFVTAATLTAPMTDYLPAGVFVAGGVTNTCGGTITAVTGSSTVTLTGATIPVNGSCNIRLQVTAPANGTYVNTIPIGALQTSNGSNSLAARATLLVSPTAGSEPTLTKAFAPATISNDGVSTLTITLKNPSSTLATLTAPLTDNLPQGMTVYGAASNSCGGAVSAAPGSGIVTLIGGAIPAGGSCTVIVPITAHCSTYLNVLPSGSLQTSNGSNREPAQATLTVTAY